MDGLCEVFISALEKMMKWELLDLCTMSKAGLKKVGSPKAMCRYVVGAAIRSMLGSHLHHIEPDTLHYMLGSNDFA